MTTNNLDEALQAAVRIRKLLSKTTHAPIQPVIAPGVVPRLVQLLAAEGFTPSDENQAALMRLLQLECAWCITNIASGTAEQTITVIEARAAPVLIKITEQTDNMEMLDQCIWALGNIAGDSPQCRDYVLHLGILPPS